MDSKIEMNHLSQDELSYELLYRGIADAGTVEIMRKSLRALIRAEKSGSKLSYPEYSIPFKDDAEALSAKIQELTDAIEDFEDTLSSHAYKRLSSKLSCALGRVNRCKPTAD